MRAYDHLCKAFQGGKPVPKLTISLSSVLNDTVHPLPWGASLDATVIQVEHIIVYWSRTFKPAKCNYSTTEHEALAAKEGLVKFQPFLEGEKVLLLMDHVTLQWACMYENNNSCLAAWGTIFSAYQPFLEIIHHPGHIYLNVDPLSCLLQHVPSYDAPLNDDVPSLHTNHEAATTAEECADQAPAAHMAAFCMTTLDEVMEAITPSCFVTPSEKK